MWNLEPLLLTEQDVRTLRTLRVDENGPGTILHDFEALLSYIRGHGLSVSKVNQVPSLTLLPQINALLARPIEVRLKRPVLKSYPQLEGLYLLLRATGLGQVGGTGSKPMLLVDPALYAAWSALNPTERYFNLLETWLLRGDPEIVGAGTGASSDPVRQFIDAAEMMRRAGDEGLQIEDNNEVAWFWNYSPGKMGIALLELFGLLRVVTRPPQEGEGWVVDRVYRTPLGMAALAVLHQGLFSDLGKVLHLMTATQDSLGALQPLLVPYVPEWQHNLAPPEWDFRPGRYTFKVSLGRGLWRRIAIDAQEPLDTLAGMILDAYDFDYDHLYEFTYRNRLGMEAHVQHPYMDEGPWAPEVRIGELPLAVGQSMTYLYDFGDEWTFEVKLEEIDPAAEEAGPAVVDEAGEAPEQYPDWDEEEW